MNTTTVGNTSHSAVSDLLAHTIFGIQGLVITLGSGLILFTILFEKSLRERKEKLIIAGQAATTLISGFGSFALSIYRITVIILDAESNPSTAMSCVLLSPVFLVYIGGQSTTLTNLAVSIDRYIAISHPIKYRLLNTNYAKRLLGVVAIITIVTVSTMFLSTYFGTSRVHNLNLMCTGLLFPLWYFKFHCAFVAGIGLLSIAVYLGVYLAYFYVVQRINPQNRISGSSDLDIQRSAQQNRLTVTLGIIAVSTLLFQVCPAFVLAFATFFEVSVPQQYIWMAITKTSTLINIGIYVIRQKEIRKGMRNLLMCKMKAVTHGTALSSVHPVPVNRTTGV